MAQFYTLEEAARVLGMNPEELKGKAQHREIRAFMDSGSWRFRVADIDELARRRGLGSDPDFALSDSEISLANLDLTSARGSGSGSDEIDLSEFEIGTAKPTSGQPSIDLPTFGDDVEKDILLDDQTVPQGGAAANSSSTILGMKGAGKEPSDSDVRLVPENFKSASDSDVRLAPVDRPRAPSDSDVTLVSDDESGSDFSPGSKDASTRKGQTIGSSAEVPAADESDFTINPSSVISALQPDSGSDFELSALDTSEEFDATPLPPGPSDSDVTAAAPADSGINLGQPSDSGINLGGIEGLNLDSADSIELAPLDDDSDSGQRAAIQQPKAPEPAKPSKNRSALSATPPPVVGKGEKDIFEDTDFEVDALSSGEADDRTMQLEAASDFDIDESDSASEVFAMDEDDVDENASTAMAPAVLDEDEDEFETDDAGGAGEGGWDVDSEPATAVSAGSQGTVIPTSRDNVEWGGLWVGFLGVGTVLTLLAAFVAVDLIRNLYDFRGGGPASGIIQALAGLFPK